MTKKYGDHFEINVSPLESQILNENEVTQSNVDLEDTSQKPKTNAKKDLKNITLILFLYILQGIPLGLLVGLPLILSSRKVSYADQGTLSFALWPHSFKILWAPIVDSFYIESIGRRKSWIITVQLLLALVSFTSGDYLNKIISIEYTRTSQDIVMLTLVFIVISFLIATHEIIMDGWAIDLLLKENVSMQATCSSVGIIIGSFTGNAAFILLESTNFCNRNLRPLLNLPSQPYGFIDIKIFLFTYGSLLFTIAVFILVFKSEKNPNKKDEEAEKRSVCATYKLIWKLLCKSEIRALIFVYLTIKLGFGTEAIIRLRLIEEGVEKEKITLIGVMLSPVMILLPVLLNKYLNGPRPLNLMINSYAPKLLIISCFTFFVVLTPYIKNENSGLPLYYYSIYFLLNMISTSFTFIFNVSFGSFNSQISDKSIGGTYMTFLSLWPSIGTAVTRTSVLYLTNFFTFKSCFHNESAALLSLNDSSSMLYDRVNVTSNLNDLFSNKCSSESLAKECVSNGGSCLKYFDGFYLLSFVFICVGFVWLIFCKKIIAQLQLKPKSAWLLTK